MGYIPMEPAAATHSISTRFESTRLVLRAYQPGDGSMYYQIGQKNQVHLQRYESSNSILRIHNPEEGERLIQEHNTAWQKGDYYMLGAFDRVTGEFVAQIYVGTVSLELPEYEVGYFADRDHEGMGFITEAVKATLAWIFNELKAQRISLRCRDTNYRSARVAERCGFTQEGHLRRNRRDPDGTLSGDLIYGLLPSEFEQNPQQ
jgi:RimJ/RimL family protein N-acetyltransferase